MDKPGLTWDQCLSVAYEGCAEVLAKRVQELERERGLLREGNLASVEQACAAAWKAEDVSEAGPQGIAGGNTHDETVDACPTCVASALAAAESRGYVRGLREALALAQDGAHIPGFECNPPDEFCGQCACTAIVARLKEAER